MAVNESRRANDGSEPPAKPTGLSVDTEQGSLDVSVEWDEVDGAAHYLVRWRSTEDGAKLNDGIEVESTETSTIISVADYGQWVVRVQGCNGAGCGDPLAKQFRVEPAPAPPPEPTPEATPEPTPEPTPDPTPDPMPAKPTGLRVSTEPGSLDVAVDWDAVDGATSYKVRWRTAEDGSKLNDGVEVESTEATVTVEDYGQWVVRVQGCNDSGCGDPLAKQFQLEPEPEETPEPTPAPTKAPKRSVPGSPSNLSVSVSLGERDLSAAWDATDGADSYQLRWRKSDGSFESGNEVTVSATSADFTVSEHGQWVVQLEGCNDAGCGPAVAQTVAIVPGSPSNLSVSVSLGERDVSAAWDAADGADSYKLRWRTHDGDFQAGNEETTTATSADFTVPEHGRWVVQVEGCNDAGCGPGITQTVAIAPGSPSNLEVSSSPGELDLSATWDAADGADSYKLRWKQPDGDFQAGNEVTTTATSADFTVGEHGEWLVQLAGCNDSGCGPSVEQEHEVEQAAEPATDSTQLSVSIEASTLTPLVGTPMELGAAITNAPEEGGPRYSWQLDFGGWYEFGTNATFSYIGSGTESQAFRVTITYRSGESATSDPLTVTWVAEQPNRAPVVDEDAAAYDAFVQASNAPLGIAAVKSFEGIFSDPDDDPLTYSSLFSIARGVLLQASTTDVETMLVGILLEAASDWGCR